MYGFVVTTAGEGLLARAAGGETLTITGTRVGSGSVAGESAARALTALIQDQAAGTYSTPEVSGGQLSMVVEYRNNLNGGLQAGFTLREFGVFARVGDDAPTLMYYAALGDRAPEVPPITEGLDVHRWPVAVAVSGELAVTVEDPSGAFVDDSKLQKYLPLAGGTMTGPLALDALQVGTKGKGVVVGLDNAGTLETPVVQVASQYGSGPAVLRGVAQAQQSGDALPKGQADGAYLPKSQKGQPGGVASLDGAGKVPGEQLPEMNYVQNITRTATVAAGQSIQAGDAVALNEAGQAMDSAVAHDGNQEFQIEGDTSLTECACCPRMAGEVLVAAISQHSASEDSIRLHLVRDEGNGVVSLAYTGNIYFTENTQLENLCLAKISDNKFALTVGWTEQSSTKKVYLGLIRVEDGQIKAPAYENLVETEMTYGVPVYLGESEVAVYGQDDTVTGTESIRWDRYDVSGTSPTHIQKSPGVGVPDYTALSATLAGNRVVPCIITEDGQVRAAVRDVGSVIIHSGSGAQAVACCTGGDGHVHVVYTVSSGGSYAVQAAELAVGDGLTLLGTATLLNATSVRGVAAVNANGTAVALYGGRFARALTHNTSGELTGGNQYAFRSSAAAGDVVSAAGSGVTGADCGLTFKAERTSTPPAWRSTGTRSRPGLRSENAQAIALEDGGAGENIELLFSGHGGAARPPGGDAHLRRQRRSGLCSGGRVALRHALLGQPPGDSGQLRRYGDLRRGEPQYADVPIYAPSGADRAGGRAGPGVRPGRICLSRLQQQRGGGALPDVERERGFLVQRPRKL